MFSSSSRQSDGMRKMMQIAKDLSRKQSPRRTTLSRTNSEVQKKSSLLNKEIRGHQQKIKNKRRRYSTGGFDPLQGPPVTMFNPKIKKMKSSPKSRMAAKRRRFSMSSAPTDFTRRFQTHSKKLQRSNSMSGDSKEKNRDDFHILNPPDLTQELKDFRNERKINRELSLTLKRNLSDYNKAKHDDEDDLDLEVEEVYPFYIILPDDMKRMIWVRRRTLLVLTLLLTHYLPPGCSHRTSCTIRCFTATSSYRF